MNPLNAGFRRFALFTLAAAVLLSGCSNRYVITTTNGSKIITSRKPKRVDSKYVFKDGYGKTNEIPVMRVRVIEPYSKEAAGKLPRNPDLQ
ncbi:MAG: YgdI/YgdR family lipoprotein [Limisphaerales bacterium]